MPGAPGRFVMSIKTKNLEKLALSLSNWLNWVAGAALVAMLCLVVADIIGARLFKWPIPGGIEMIGFLGVIVVAFSIAQTQVVRGHIDVEFLVTRFPNTVQKAIACIVYSFGMLLFALIAWRSYDFGRMLQATGEVSMTQEIPFYPFVYCIAFSCVSVLLVLLVQLLREMTRA